MENFRSKLKELFDPTEITYTKNAVDERLVEIIDSGVFNGKNIVLFPAGYASEFALSKLSKRGYTVTHVVDNDIRKHGRKIGSLTVESPLCLVPKLEETIIFIPSTFAHDIFRQIQKLGYNDRDCVIIHDLYGDLETMKYRQRNDVIYSEAIIYYGFEQYVSLRSKYDKSITLLLFPAIGTGDAYLLCAFLNCYIKQNSLGKYKLIVSTSAQENIARDFGFADVDILDISKARSIVSYLNFMNWHYNEVQGIHVLYWQNRDRHGVIGERCLPSTKLNLYDFYTRLVLKLTFRPERSLMKTNQDSAKIRGTFHDMGLFEGKTAILSPYNNTFMEFPEAFWETIAIKLTSKGYAVCTNVGKKDEKPIEGTIPLSVPHDSIIPIAEIAGLFIGIRSGLCDILSQANCEKIILYPPHSQMESIKNFFSLRDYDLFPKRLHEYSAEEIDEETIIENIMEIAG
jgi:hypothetical protein